MSALAILGGGGQAKVVADAAIQAGWTGIVFFDDAFPMKTQIGKWPVQGNFQALLNNLSAFDGVVIGIGDNAARLERQRAAEQAGARIVSIVHPRATVSPAAHIGSGTVVFAGAVVNCDAVIGDACIINTGVTIDHDCVLEDGVHISPGANLAGGVAIGALSWVGIGAVVIQQIKIGRTAMVGAGTVVIRPVQDGAVVVGNPARELNKDR